MAEVDILLCPKQVAHNDPWRADKMDIAAKGMDWAAKDFQAPSGNFDADYEALCRYVNCADGIGDTFLADKHRETVYTGYSRVAMLCVLRIPSTRVLVRYVSTQTPSRSVLSWPGCSNTTRGNPTPPHAHCVPLRFHRSSKVVRGPSASVSRVAQAEGSNRRRSWCQPRETHLIFKTIHHSIPKLCRGSHYSAPHDEGA